MIFKIFGVFSRPLAWVDTSPWATVLRELTMFMKQKEISLHQMQFYICKLNTCNTHEDTTFPEVLSLGNCIEGVNFMKEYVK